MIKDDVRDGHLYRFPNEHSIVNLLERDFDINWASRITKFNTSISVYFLKALPHISQAFGFEQEILCAISDYPTLEARAIQAIEQTFLQLPAKGRVDQTVALIISSSEKTETWVKEYTAQNPQARAYVGICEQDFKSANGGWFLRNLLIKQLFSRDLFDYTLPLDNDLFFFGRQAIVVEHTDAIRRSENRGLFGLRKTGKTSILFKIMRQSKDSQVDSIYYDCKVPSIYRLSGEELLSKICDDTEKVIRTNFPKAKIRNKNSNKKYGPAERFRALIEDLPNERKLCFLFDEIEYIAGENRLAPHWTNDFVPFWQTIWSVQSQIRKFSFVIAGVNASVSEKDKIDGVQNPIFGIVRAKYLTGFEKDELRSLTRVFGRRMGLNFDETAIEKLHERYGGHPLLSRIICSQINTGFKAIAKQRPIRVADVDILRDLQDREEEIQFYCAHITSELEEFYEIEYEMLELLAVGNIVDFNELSQDVDTVRHLKAYGLVDFSRKFEPSFRIPVLKGYIAAKWKKKNKQPANRYIVSKERRAEYVLGRLSSIIRELRAAEKKFNSLSLSPLYGQHGPSEAELLVSSGVCGTKMEIIAFLTQCNRSFVEPIDRTGKNANKKNYFFKDVKSDFPTLWYALNRVRSYRNHLQHLEMTPSAEKNHRVYLDEDFDGVDPASLVDGWFRVQQAVLDGLLVAVHAEISRFD